MTRILVDMNLSPRWATVLKSAGIEASHWSAVGSPHALGRVAGVIRRLDAELNEGVIVTIEPGRERVRILPLKPP
jgi:predicted nuclease of predicted toxin-antitoxin system